MFIDVEMDTLICKTDKIIFIIPLFFVLAVLMAEVFKLIICTGLVMQEAGGVEKGARSMFNIVILNVKDTLRVCVPSFLYIVQNNLLYVSASNLDAATYQASLK